jgi:hypothetical protein
MNLREEQAQRGIELEQFHIEELGRDALHGLDGAPALLNQRDVVLGHAKTPDVEWIGASGMPAVSPQPARRGRSFLVMEGNRAPGWKAGQRMRPYLEQMTAPTA